MYGSFVKFYLTPDPILNYQNHFSLEIRGLDQIKKIRLNYIIEIAVNWKQMQRLICPNKGNTNECSGTHFKDH